MNTVSAHARNNYLYMQECGYFRTSSPYYTERSSLPSYLILYTLSGQGLLQYEHDSYPLKAGCCFYIDCMQPHRYEPQKGQEWEFLWLHFHGISAGGYYMEFHSTGSPVVLIQEPFLMESTLRRIPESTEGRLFRGAHLQLNHQSCNGTGCAEADCFSKPFSSAGFSSRYRFFYPGPLFGKSEPGTNCRTPELQQVPSFQRIFALHGHEHPPISHQLPHTSRQGTSAGKQPVGDVHCLPSRHPPNEPLHSAVPEQRRHHSPGIPQNVEELLGRHGLDTASASPRLFPLTAQ